MDNSQKPISEISKREWFAGMAMLGMLANPTVQVSPERISTEARIQADLQLAELEKKP